MKREDFELDEIMKSIDMLCLSSDGTDIGLETLQEQRGYSEEELEQMGISDAQKEEIHTGMSQFLPVWHYAKTCYNWKQMREIRMGLQENLDISFYENDLFSAEQMREIRMGLQEQLDVSSYAKLILSAKDMSSVRREMMNDSYLRTPYGRAKVIWDEESDIRIRISDDCMEAFLTMPEHRTYSAPQLKRILKKYDINCGLIETQLRKAAAGETGEEEILVAKGKEAKIGKDGRYEYFFERQEKEPKINADGSVDYAQIIVADKRCQGEVLAKYYPAERGADGETVTGILVRGVHGKEKPALRGRGIIRDKERNEYTAAVTGYVLFDEEERTLNVWNVYVVDEDVNRYNGNISYDGIIHIRGSVSDMAQIEATGDVIVDGYVEGAHIKAGENIFLRSGMNGCGKGTLEAGGRVSGQFFEAASIYAGGNVEGSYFLNCHVVTDRSLIAREANSRILGGSVQAGYSVEIGSVLGSGKAAASIDVGNPVWIEEKRREAEEHLTKTRGELQKLNEGKENLAEMFGKKARAQNELFHKIGIAIRMKEEEEQELLAAMQSYEKTMNKAKRAYIQVSDRIQAGAVMSVGGRMKKIEKDLDGVVFRRETVCGTKF